MTKKTTFQTSIKTVFVFVIIFYLTDYCLLAQSAESLLARGKTYYEKAQYRDALNLLNKYIAKDSSNAEAYKLLGNCYLEVNQIETAMESYKKALIVDASYSDAYFNIANTYSEIELLDSAERYYRNYIALEPALPEGYVSLAFNQFNQGKFDSVLCLYEYAYQLDSTRLSTILILAQQYMIEEAFEKSVYYTNKGKEIDARRIDLYLINGMSEFNQMHFDESIIQADSALLIDSLNFEAFVLGLESNIMKLTAQSEYYQDDYYDFKFNKYTSTNLKNILKKDSLVDYSTLEKSMNNGEVLSLDKYFQFYITQRTRTSFSPYYQSSNPKIDEYFDNENFNGLSEFTELVLKMNPLNLEDIYKVAVANYLVRKMDNFRRLYAIYFGIIESITSTGTGEDYDSAYVVISTSDEYAVLNYSGLQATGQVLQHYEGHTYDVLSTINEYGEKQEVYFNIDIPFSTLNKKYSSKQRKNKKRKKKKN